MSLAKSTVSRPVATTMAAVCAFLFGLLSFRDVPLDLLPDLTYPAITIEVPFTGASPQEVESLVVRPIEDAVAVSQGLVRLRSTCLAGQGRVSLLFRWGTAMDLAALETREKLQQVQLPDGAGTPVVLRFDPTLDPVLRFGLTIPGASEAELIRLRRLAEDQLKPALERLEGVAAARVRGGFEEEVLVHVRPSAVALEGVSLDEVVSKLEAESVNLAGGVLREGRLEYRVRTLNELRELDQLRKTVVARRGDATLELGQLATVERGTAERTAVTRLDGREAIEVAVFKASGQNTVSVVEAVKKRLSQLERPGALLDGARVAITADQSFFITSALDDLTSTAWWGALFAVLVLLLFLDDLRATLIIGFSIPLSLVTTFLLMRVAGVSLNVMSLSGIALAIGMLVDNAIVVLEAIAAQRERIASGAVPAPTSLEDDPAVTGTATVSRAVIASTLTTLSVFVPVLFVEGVASRLFGDQALTLAFALLASLIASLSVIPMLASTTLLWRTTDLLGKVLRLLLTPLRIVFDAGWTQVQAIYPQVLRRGLRRPVLVLLAAVIVTGAALVLGSRLGADFLPDMHPGLLDVEVSLPQGSSLRETDLALTRLAKDVGELEGVKAVFTTAGAVHRAGEQDEVRESVGQMLVRLQPGLGAAGEERVAGAIRKRFAAEPGLLPPAISRPGLVSVRTPLEVLIDGRDLTRLKAASEAVVERVSAIPGVIDVRSSARGGRPEIRVSLDRRKLAQYDLDAGSVSQTLETAVRGRVGADLVQSDRDVPIRVTLRPDARASVADLERIVVSPAGRPPITLRSVGRVEQAEGPAEIRRDGQRRVAVVTAEVQGRDLASAVEEIRSRLSDYAFPPGLNWRLGGSATDLGQAFTGLGFAIGLAILLVYLLLAAQFESFRHPLIILGAIPLAGAGAALGLWLAGTTLSVVVLIGLIVLAGIVVNNAILLVDRINQLRRGEGVATIPAIEQACRDRLRPIVMTTSTTVLGLLPLLVAPGEGAELRRPLAVTLVSGLLGATLLTLVVIPAAYVLVDGRDPEPEADPKP